MSEIEQIAAELQRAVAKFPTWPTDPFHALAVLGEEYGELQKAVLQRTYEPHKGVAMEDIRSEAIQTAAMAIRWITSIDLYRFEAGEQHAQAASPPSTHPLLTEARERLSFWAEKRTIDEVMGQPVSEDDWMRVGPEDRIKLMGERKQRHDAEVLAARALLARIDAEGL